MIVDILFVVGIIGILIAIYKTKFAHKKSTEQIKAEIIRETSLQKPTQKPQQASSSLKPQPSTSTEWTGEEQQASDSEDESDDISPNNARLSLYKEQKRKQKQQRKEAQQHFLEQQKTKRDEYQKLQEEKQREEEQKRKKEEEYMEMMREEEKKRKEEEFNKWKDMFAVQETGVSKESEDILKKKEQQLESNLLNYLITKKLSLLQDASHKFSLTTKDLVQKIKKLESEQKVSGVFDERGKFLYIEQREWDAVRNYINAKGRLKKSDMMTECAKIIKIPEDQDEELIRLVNEVEEKQ